MNVCHDCLRLERALALANEDLRVARANPTASYSHIGIAIAVQKVANAYRNFAEHADTHESEWRYIASSTDDDDNSTSGPVR